MLRSRNKELDFRKSHAFVIGINQYPKLNSNLKTAATDAKEVAVRLKVLQGFDNVLLMQEVGKAQLTTLFDWLQDENRSKTLEISDETFQHDDFEYQSKISWLTLAEELEDTQSIPSIDYSFDLDNSQQSGSLFLTKSTSIDIEPGDSIVFYYAGHGFPAQPNSGSSGNIAPTDAKNLKVDNDSLIPMDELYKSLSKLACKHTLLILDCCYAGKFRFSSTERGDPVPFLVPMYKRRFQRFKKGVAWQVLVSAGPNEKAADSATLAGIRDHSPFAKTLIDALEGKADLPVSGNRGKKLKDGLITASELFLYVWDKVEHITSGMKPQHPSLFPMKQHGVGEFIFINPNISTEQFQFAEDPDKNPYKGLLPYQSEDAKFFFGRDRAIKKVLDQLAENEKNKLDPILFITGGSGSGKSSLIRAGVFPKLKTKGFAELLAIRPEELINVNKGNSEGELEKIREKLLSGDRHVLLMDQYEELFTHVEKKKLLIIVNELFNLVLKHKHVLFFSLRSDFTWQVKNDDLLKSYWKNEMIYRIPPMNLDELREALTGPARWAMYDFNDKEEIDEQDTGEELINEILEEIANAPGALPMLSFTMQEFYEIAKERDQRLILSDYKNKLKGIEGALSNKADQLYNSLSEKEKIVMKKLMLRMVNLYDGAFARRRVYYSELTELVEDSNFTQLSELSFPKEKSLVKKMIDKLEAANLVVQDRDAKTKQAFVEPAHDALITHWETCRKWLDEFGKENLLLQRQLWQAVLDHFKTKEAEDQENFSQNVRAVNATEEMLDQGDVLTVTSSLWDNSPKLLQVLNEMDFQISKETNEEILSTARGPITPFELRTGKPPQKEDFFVERFKGLSEEELVQLFYKHASWLNEVELYFIFESWNLRQDRYAKLMQERDEAIKAKELAEAKTREATAGAFAAKARASFSKNQLLGFNQAYEGYKIAATKETVDTLNEISSNTNNVFYKTIPINKSIDVLDFSPDGTKIFITKKETGFLLDIDGNEIAQFNEHTDHINCAIFSPDGKSILTAGEDKLMLLWNLDGKISKRFETHKGHKAMIHALGFSQDRTKIISGGDNYDCTAVLWDVQTGEVVQRFKGHERGLVYATHFLDSEGVPKVLTGGRDKKAILWDIEGNELRQIKREIDTVVDAVTFSPKSNLVLFNGSSAAVYNHLGKHVNSFRSPSAMVNHIALSPDGIKCVVAGNSESIKIRDIKTRRSRIYTAHTKNITGIAFSKNTSKFITSGADRTLVLWDLSQQGKQMCKAYRKLGRDDLRARYNNVAFSSDGNSFMSMGENKTARLMDLSGKVLQSFQNCDHFVLCKKVNLILIASGSEARLYDFSGKELQVFSGHSEKITAIAITPDGEYILTGSEDEKAMLWEKNGTLKTTFEHKNTLISVAISDDGKQVLTCLYEVPSFGGYQEHWKTFLWDHTGTQLQKKDHAFAIQAVAFAPDSNESFVTASYGPRVAGGDGKGTVELWNVKGDRIKIFNVEARTIDFSLDGKFLLIGGGNSELPDETGIWDMRTGQKIQSFFPPENLVTPIDAVAFSPDGTKVLLAYNVGLVYLCNNQVARLENKMIDTLEEVSLTKKTKENKDKRYSKLFYINGQWVKDTN